MDLRQTREYAKYMELIGWEVVRLAREAGRGKVVGYTRKLPLLPWSVMKLQRFGGLPKISELRAVQRKRRVVYTIVEPLSELLKNWGSFSKSKSSYLPTATRVVNLRLSKEKLWKGLSKDARSIIKKSGEVMKIKEIKGQQELWSFWREWKRSGRGYVPGWQKLLNLLRCFGTRKVVLGGFAEERLVAGTVILMSDSKAYYYFAWTNREGRKGGAQYKLVWEAIILAKKGGCEIFDFEGVEDERYPKKSWRGFSLFKKKFGGEEVLYPGCWGKWF